MNDRYLEHLTLTTGHSRRSPRSEVPDEVVSTLRLWLDRALAGGDMEPLPGDLEQRFGAVAVKGAGLIVTLYNLELGAPVGIVKFGVAGRSRHSRECWKILTSVAATDAKQPAVPWCAAVLYPAAFDCIDDLPWVGDFERCVAWAWLEGGKLG